MSKGVIFINSIVVLLLVFVVYNIVLILAMLNFHFELTTAPAKNVFYHFRHYIRWLRHIFIWWFYQLLFWILKEQTIRTNIGHVQIYNSTYFETANKIRV